MRGPSLNVSDVTRDVACSRTHNTGIEYVLSEHDSLAFNHEEVDQLFKVVKRSFQSLTWDRVIAFGSERSGKTATKSKLSGNLGNSRDYK